MSETFTHRPVLLDECIQALAIRPEGIYLDGTLGRAGHSREIARRLTTGRLICVDRDQAALDAAQERLAPWMDRVTLVHSNFDQLNGILDELALDGVDGMLFDLGVSSPQLDDGSRGFSYMADAPLDMRMDRDQGLSAADVVNGWSQEELRRILTQYGEERYAASIAAAIVRRRADKPIETTLELVDVIPGGPDRQDRSGRVFQGLHLSAGFSRVCVREDAGCAACFPKTHPALRAGGGGEPQGPQCQAAGGGKAEGPGRPVRSAGPAVREETMRRME